MSTELGATKGVGILRRWGLLTAENARYDWIAGGGRLW